MENDSGYLVVAVYVDDLLIATSNTTILRIFKQQMSDRFDMKDLGEPRRILGINVSRDRQTGTIHLCQQTYIHDILTRHSMENAKPMLSPMDKNERFVEATPETALSETDRQLYQSIVGSLMYAMLGTRPDIAYAVGLLSRFLAKPSQTHLSAAKRVLRYLRSTLTHGITFSQGPNAAMLRSYVDADFAGCIQTSRSTGGDVHMLAGGAISWSSKRQPLVTLSTTEAEYVALARAASECIWLRDLLSELKCPQSAPTTVHEDNQGCVALVMNPKFHARTKHIRLKYHFTREKQENGEINVVYCPTDKMLADVLTKALDKDRHWACVSGMGMTKCPTRGSVNGEK
jgi:hypothetical protein